MHVALEKHKALFKRNWKRKLFASWTLQIDFKHSIQLHLLFLKVQT